MEKGTFELIKAISKDDNRLIQIQQIAGNIVSGNQRYFVIEEHLFRQMVDEIEAKQKEVFELDESLHISRVSRRDLITYVKQLKDLLSRVNELLEVETYPSDYPKDLLEEVKNAVTDSK